MNYQYGALVQWGRPGKTDLDINLQQCYLVRHKLHIDWHEIEYAPKRSETGVLTARATARPSVE